MLADATPLQPDLTSALVLILCRGVAGRELPTVSIWYHSQSCILHFTGDSMILFDRSCPYSQYLPADAEVKSKQPALLLLHASVDVVTAWAPVGLHMSWVRERARLG